MWKKTICGIVSANIETLEYYQIMKDNERKIEKDIYLFVEKGINNLPFFLNFPLKLYCGFIGFFNIITTCHLPNTLHSESKIKFLRRMQVIPFFGILNKLIRAMILLRLFDYILPSRDKNDK